MSFSIIKIYWYRELRTKLAAHGFEPTHADRCLFAKHDNDSNIVAQLLVYVDDCLVAARASEQVIAVVSIIAESLEVRTWGSRMFSWVSKLAETQPA